MCSTGPATCTPSRAMRLDPKNGCEGEQKLRELIELLVIMIEGIRCIGDQLHVGIVLNDGEDDLKLFVMTMR